MDKIKAINAMLDVLIDRISNKPVVLKFIDFWEVKEGPLAGMLKMCAEVQFGESKSYYHVTKMPENKEDGQDV